MGISIQQGPFQGYVADKPSDHGLVEWTFDPAIATIANANASGALIVARLVARTGGLVSNIHINLSALGSSLTAATNATISGAANNGSGLVRVTATGHGYSTNDVVTIASVTGTTEANGAWVITVIDANTFDLAGSVFAHAYVSGGTATRSANVAAIYSSAGAFLSATGDQVSAWGTALAKTMALATPITLTPGSAYYVGILSTGGTPITAFRGATVTLATVGESGAGLRFATAGTSLTKLPSAIVPANNVTTSAFSIWMGLS